MGSETKSETSTFSNFHQILVVVISTFAATVFIMMFLFCLYKFCQRRMENRYGHYSRIEDDGDDVEKFERDAEEVLESTNNNWNVRVPAPTLHATDPLIDQRTRI